MNVSIYTFPYLFSTSRTVIVIFQLQLLRGMSYTALGVSLLRIAFKMIYIGIHFQLILTWSSLEIVRYLTF